MRTRPPSYYELSGYGTHYRFLAPLPNGTYEVTTQNFSPECGFEDELGSYGSIVKFVARPAKRRR